MPNSLVENLMGYDISCIDLERNDKEYKGVFQTINAYSYVMAKNNEVFSNALKNATYLIPDGFPVVLASRILKNKKIRKIAGEDIFFYFIKAMNKLEGRVFFIGSTEETLSKIKTRLSREYPNINVDTYSPPYKKVFSDEDSSVMLKKINDFDPNVVFIGMTAPKQEMWVEKYKTQIKSDIICSIGAVFDFYAETIQRAPRIYIKLKLEWFYRLIKEPKRMWKRYLIYSPIFFWDLFLFLLRIKK